MHSLLNSGSRHCSAIFCLAFAFLATPADASLQLAAQTEHQYFGLSALAQSPSLLVAVGAGGTPGSGINALSAAVYTSPDAGTWTWKPTGTASALRGIAWSGTQWTAVGDYGAVVTSPDGSTWTLRTSGTGEHLNGLMWSGTEFIAVGGAGTIIASIDGATWTSRTSATSNALNAIARSPSRYVAIGEGGAIVTSPDGVTWTLRTSNTTKTLNGITWSGSQFVAVGAAGAILTSPDGTTWTFESAGADAAYYGLYGVSWSGTTFAVVGNVNLTSPDGKTWNRSETSGDGSRAVIWTGSRFLSTGGCMCSSPDGITWTFAGSGGYGGEPLQSVTWTGSRFFGVGANGATASSPDGTAWRHSIGPSGSMAVVWSPTLSRFVLVGGNLVGTVATSPDAINWTFQPSGQTPAILYGVVWSGTQFVAVGNAVLTSPDGITWTNRTSGASNHLKGIAWSGSLYVAVGENIITSPDGATWSTRTSVPASDPLIGVASSGTRFVAMSWTGMVMTSSDGIAWTTQNLHAGLNGVIWARDRFVITQINGEIYTSPDGTTWTSQSLPYPLSLRGGLATSDNMLVLTGVGVDYNAPIFRTLTVTKAGAGSGMITSLPAGVDCGATCETSFYSDTSVVLTATPSAGSAFAGWSGLCNGTGTCQVTVDGPKSVTASFTKIPYLLTVTKAGAGGGTVTSIPAGINCGATCAASFDSFTSVTLTAAPASDSLFAGWSGGGCTGTGTCDVTMDAAKTVTATFAPLTNIPRLGNISTRMHVLTGNDVMIGGFIIGGSTPKTVVVRARGPSLSAFGIINSLANPTLDLYSGPSVIASNDDWGSAANASAISASGFAPDDARESAILVTLNAGAYTAIVSGVGNTTGVGLIEVFEVDHPEVPLVNISTRGQVLTINDVMIGGFIISGAGPQTLVIRARGPSLIPFGITNALANPVLQLFSGQTLVASNDDWFSATNAAQISASGFAPGDPLESAILITLQPGAYTAIVTGAGGTTGVGIVEVFAQ